MQTMLSPIQAECMGTMKSGLQQRKKTIASVILHLLTLIPVFGIQDKRSRAAAKAQSIELLAGLIAVRLIWGVIGSRHARFSNFIPSYQALQAYLNIGPQVDRAKKEEQHGHNPLGALMIVNLLVTLTAIILTGHLMTTLTFLAVSF